MGVGQVTPFSLPSLSFFGEFLSKLETHLLLVFPLELSELACDLRKLPLSKKVQSKSQI